MKTFKDLAAKKEFSRLYYILDVSKQAKFGELIRAKALEKVTSLELTDDFYLDKIDVLVEFNKLN